MASMKISKQIWAVMTHSMQVMRVMNTEKGAKKYATQRGLGLVGRIVTPTTVDSIRQRGSVWGGLTRNGGCAITRYGWIPYQGDRKQITIVRGTKAINKHFNKD